MDPCRGLSGCDGRRSEEGSISRRERLNGEELEGAVQGQMEASYGRPCERSQVVGRNRSEMGGRHLDEQYEYKKEEETFHVLHMSQDRNVRDVWRHVLFRSMIRKGSLDQRRVGKVDLSEAIRGLKIDRFY